MCVHRIALGAVVVLPRILLEKRPQPWTIKFDMSDLAAVCTLIVTDTWRDVAAVDLIVVVW